MLDGPRLLPFLCSSLVLTSINPMRNTATLLLPNESLKVLKENLFLRVNTASVVSHVLLLDPRDTEMKGRTYVREGRLVMRETKSTKAVMIAKVEMGEVCAEHLGRDKL